MTVKDLEKLHQSIAQSLRLYRGSVRQLRPARLDADAQQHLEQLKASNEGLLRLVRNKDENERIRAEIRSEYEGARRRAAAVARYRAHSIRTQTAEARATIDRARRDASASFPRALDGLSADGMATLALVRVHTATALASLDAGALLAIYQQALARQDMLGLVQVETVESMVGSAPYRADGPQDLASAKALRERIEDVQALRIPALLPDFEALDDEVSRLDARADLLAIVPVNPERDQQAADAFTQQQPDLLEAGAASDLDDEQARRAGRQAAS